ncbi:MAG: Na+/H+ antiporter subunit E [Coprococcus sp.]|nr:Na+/H+ antiporter subunit E [Coprococcus sp.]
MYLLYFLLWVIFNGAFTLEICLFGLLISAAVFAFTCKFMDYSLEKEKRNMRKIFRFLRYIWVLVVEIVKANFTVIHMIISEREEIEPALVAFQSNMKTPAGRAFLANAITLTPGTITVMLEESDYLVHCLDESLAAGMDDSVFVELLSDLEQEKERKREKEQSQEQKQEQIQEQKQEQSQEQDEGGEQDGKRDTGAGDSI